MRFEMIDQVSEIDEKHIVACKLVSMAEEYLQDHFPTFPVLPGVLMLETMVQAARKLLEHNGLGSSRPMVLGSVRALKYGSFVKPGCTLRVEVTLFKPLQDNSFEFKGKGVVLGGDTDEDAPTAVSGRFVLRPATTMLE